MDKMKYGLMTYHAHPKQYNVGDYIQSLAAEQYLPRVDTYINREALSSYNGDPVKMIMNGWYMHNPEKWPPSERINPLFVSFHLNAQAQDKMLSPAGIAYLKRHEPIGCRDMHTLNALTGKGIQAYHSGCLTTTLDMKYTSPEKTGDVYLVDPFFKLPTWSSLTESPRAFKDGLKKRDFLKMGVKKHLLKQVLTESFLQNSIAVTHMYPQSQSDEQRFKIAAALLDRYARARLVVTSRIHCALPCLALGTPVIFLNYGFASDPTEICRVEGIMDLFNTVSIDDQGRITSNFGLSGSIDEHLSVENPGHYLPLAKALKLTCSNFTGLS